MTYDSLGNLGGGIAFSQEDVGYLLDGTPYAMKVACTVWSGGKDGDYFKLLPIAIMRSLQFE